MWWSWARIWYQNKKQFGKSRAEGQIIDGKIIDGKSLEMQARGNIGEAGMKCYGAWM